MTAGHRQTEPVRPPTTARRPAAPSATGVLAALAALAAVAPASPALAGPIEERNEAVARLVERAAPAVWLVEAEPEAAADARGPKHAKMVSPVAGYRLVRRGVAFVEDPDRGFLLTTASVVGDARRVFIAQVRRRLECEVFAVDPDTDVALLRVLPAGGAGPAPGGPPPADPAPAKSVSERLGKAFLPLGESSPVRPGHSAFIIGPDLVPLRLSEGLVNHSDFRLAGSNEPMLVVNVAPDRGSAGTPVVAADGRVIGMVASTGEGRRAVLMTSAAPTGRNVMHVVGATCLSEPAGGRLSMFIPLGDGQSPLRLELDGTGTRVVQTVPATGARMLVERLERCDDPAKAEAAGAWTDIGFGQSPQMAMAGAGAAPAFAVPADVIRGVIDDLKAHRRVRRGQMGVIVEDADGRPGAVVVRIVEGGPAAVAGLAVSDTVTALDGKPVADADDFVRLLRARRVDDRVAVSATSPAGAVKNVTVRLANLTVAPVAGSNTVALPAPGPVVLPPQGPLGPQGIPGLPGLPTDRPVIIPADPPPGQVPPAPAPPSKGSSRKK
jgi:S1-C subfamily serine protease